MRLRFCKVCCIFLCLHLFITVCELWGVGAFGLGIMFVMQMSTLSGSFNTVLASAIVVVVARIA